VNTDWSVMPCLLDHRALNSFFKVSYVLCNIYLGRQVRLILFYVDDIINAKPLLQNIIHE